MMSELEFEQFDDGGEYDEGEPEDCDYGLTEFCIGDKMFCEDCPVNIESTANALEEAERFYSSPLNRIRRFLAHLRWRLLK